MITQIDRACDAGLDVAVLRAISSGSSQLRNAVLWYPRSVSKPGKQSMNISITLVSLVLVAMSLYFMIKIRQGHYSDCTIWYAQYILAFLPIDMYCREQHQEISCYSHVWKSDWWSARLPCNRNGDRLTMLLLSLIRSCSIIACHPYTRG